MANRDEAMATALDENDSDEARFLVSANAVEETRTSVGSGASEGITAVVGRKRTDGLRTEVSLMEAVGRKEIVV
jgi:hypothetical protein